MSALAAVAVLLILLPPGPVRAGGKLELERGNVFDLSRPGEDQWLFRLANRIHVLTRSEVVRRELLLAPGEPFDARKALETERNLRALGFIRAAEVLPAEDGGLRVRTVDAWTLKPQVSMGTEGGDHYLIAGVAEDNLLGTGRALSFHHAWIGGDARSETRFADPRLLGSRWRLLGLFTQAPDGDSNGMLVERPFFSLDTPWSARFSWARIIGDESLYRAAEERSKFNEDWRSVRSELGARLPAWSGGTHRVFAGTVFEKAVFTAGADTEPGTLPAGRTLSGPYAGVSSVQADYVKETEIDSIRRVEDFNLGPELSARAGPLLEAWGSDRDRWALSAGAQKGLRLPGGAFALSGTGLQGRLARGRAEDWIAYANLNLFAKIPQPLPQTLVVHFEFNTTGALDGEKQLMLGGNTGVRGYRNRSFAGTRTMLLNIEDRVFIDRQWWHLFYLGGAAFLDSGWTDDEGPLARSRPRSDLGVGLRLSPSRSATGAVIRLDLAYALNRGPGPSRWVVSLRGGQAFSIFNSTNRRVLVAPDAALGEESAGARLRKR
ncbi:MAG: hypothetical protein WC969_06440 [Elusimicrobiota bacterium]|jgi:hypothetical protein